MTDATLTFPRPDVDRLAKDLDLEKQGKTRGKAGLPDAAISDRDTVEHKIIAAVSAVRIQGLEQFETHARVYQERVQSAQAGLATINSAAGKAQLDLDAVLKRNDARMASARDDVCRSGAAYRRFIERNRLEGVPDAGSGWVRFLAIAAVILVVETGFNAAFFMRGSADGFLGGALIAGTISLINLCSATFFTLIARYTLHVSWFKKILGLLAVCGGLMAAAAVNLGAGHLRDSTELLQNGPEAAISALASLLATPLALQSLQSWMLVAVGLIVCAIAAAKANGIYDPYPGFGRAWNKVYTARETYADELVEAIDEIQDTARDATDELLEEADRAKRVINSVAAGATIQLGLKSRLALFLDECDQAANQLLAIYGEANRAARTTPAPVGFCAKHSFGAYQPPAIEIANTAQLAGVAAKIDDVATEAARRINDAATRAIATYPDIREMEREALGELADAAAAVASAPRREGARMSRRPDGRPGAGDRSAGSVMLLEDRLAEGDAR